MFRKLFLSALLGIGTLGGLAATPASAEAHAPIYRHHAHCRYEVRYLECGHWRCYGTYGYRREAQRVIHDLRCRGFAVSLVRC